MMDKLGAMNSSGLKYVKDISKINSSFKPKLAKGVSASFFKEDERGKFYLLRNPKNLKYIKINAPGYAVTQMFDGNTALIEIERKTNEQNIKLDVYEFTKFLAEGGFIDNLKVQKEPLEEKSIDRFSTIKYSFVKADSAFALSFYRVVSLVFSKIFLVFCAFLYGTALFLFFSNFPVILDDAFSTLRPDTPTAPLIIAFILFYVIDFMHEVAHATVFYNLGGVPKRIGFTFHYLIPFFFTDLPDVRLFTSIKSILVFLAGSLSTLFFGSISLVLYFLEPTFKTVWAMLAVGSYVSVVFTLSPFIKTDGYYILETLVKFPNFHTHALKNIKNWLECTLRILPREDYQKFRDSYSKSERRALDVYCLFLPLGIMGMIYVGALLALMKAFPEILAGISKILISPETATSKAYLSLFIALFFAIQLSYGVIVTLWRLFKWKRRST